MSNYLIKATVTKVGSVEKLNTSWICIHQAKLHLEWCVCREADIHWKQIFEEYFFGVELEQVQNKVHTKYYFAKEVIYTRGDETQNIEEDMKKRKQYNAASQLC